MGLDEIQSTWQSHDHGQRLTIDIQLLLKEVRRNHRAMEVSLRQRDFAEIFAAAIVAIAFGSMAIAMREWTLFLVPPAGYSWVYSLLWTESVNIVDESCQARLYKHASKHLWYKSNIKFGY